MIQMSIEFYFTQDHKRLEESFRQFQANKKKNYPRAKEYFKDFKFRLQHHIALEEEILFPIFEEKTSLRDVGPTAVMRTEHRKIKEALEAIHKKVQKQDPDSDREENILLAILKEHDHKEEDILYPVLDELTTYDEREEIFAKVKSLPEAKYRTCCNIKVD